MGKEKPTKRRLSFGEQDTQDALAELMKRLPANKDGAATTETASAPTEALEATSDITPADPPTEALEAASDITPADPLTEGSSPADVEGPEAGNATEAEVGTEKISSLMYDLTDNLKVPLQFSRPYSPGFLKSMAGRVANRLHDSLYTASGDAKTGKSLEGAYQEIRRSFDDKTDVQSTLQKEALDQIVDFLKQPRASSPEVPAPIAPTESDEAGIAPTKESTEIYASDPEFRLNTFIEAVRKERERNTTPHITPIVLDGTTKGTRTGHWSKKESLPTKNTGGLQVDTQTNMSHAERPRLEKEQERLPSLPFSTEQIAQLRGLGVPEETLNKLLLPETEDAKKAHEEELAPTTSLTSEQIDNIEHQKDLLRVGGMSPEEIDAFLAETKAPEATQTPEIPSQLTAEQEENLEHVRDQLRMGGMSPEEIEKEVTALKAESLPSLTPEEIVLPEGVQAALASLDKKIEETTGTPKEADWRRMKRGFRNFLNKYVAEKNLPGIQDLLDALKKYMENGSGSELLLAQEEPSSYVSGNEEKNLSAELASLQAEIAEQKKQTSELETAQKKEQVGEIKTAQEEKHSAEPEDWSEIRIKSHLQKVGIHQTFEQLRLMGFTQKEIQGLIEHRLMQDKEDAARKAHEAMTPKQRDEKVRLEEFYQALGAKPPQEGKPYEYTRGAGLKLRIEEARTELRIQKRALARLQIAQREATPPQHKRFLSRLWDKILGRTEGGEAKAELPPLLGTETLIAETGDSLWSLLEERIPKIPGFENVSKKGRDFATERYIAHLKSLSLEQIRSLGIRNSTLKIWKGDVLTKILNPDSLPKPFDFEEVLAEIKKSGI